VQLFKSILSLYLWKKTKNRLLLALYNNSSFHIFKTKNVENVESRNYQRLFNIENVEEMWKKKKWYGI
tara:strand:+ start:1246 stop:1449 length:204 start_codon:yes stop_codon:yes gene_type:complete